MEDRFGARLPGPDFLPRYNARPGQMLPVVMNTRPDAVGIAKWGIAAPWKTGQLIINTRKDSLDTKKIFKRAFRENRCFIPANGFYEWTTEEGKKVPYRFYLKHDGLFAFAGIYADDNSGSAAFTIITVEPNGIVEPIHNRMPALLPLRQEQEWLNPDLSEQQALAMLQPFPGKQMEMARASGKVNSASNEGSQLLNPGLSQKNLF